MPRTEFTLAQLERLVHAYPTFELSAETARLYLASLEDIPRRLLARAVRDWIATQPWFPKVSDLRMLAERLSGQDQLSAVELLHDPLMQRYYDLQRDFWQAAEVEPAAWEALSQDFSAADRPCMALRARQRLEQYQAWMDCAEAGENISHWATEDTEKGILGAPEEEINHRDTSVALQLRTQRAGILVREEQDRNTGVTSAANLLNAPEEENTPQATSVAGATASTEKDIPGVPEEEITHQATSVAGATADTEKIILPADAQVNKQTRSARRRKSRRRKVRK